MELSFEIHQVYKYDFSLLKDYPNPNTMLWLLELLYLFVLKYPNEKLLNTYFMKKNIQQMINDLIMKSVKFTVSNKNYIFESIDYRV